MSDIPSGVLQLLHERLRDLELDAVMIRGRTEELREAIAMLEHGPRRRAGRPPRKITVVNMPLRVDGGMAEPETAA
jgi:hypothetical protein